MKGRFHKRAGFTLVENVITMALVSLMALGLIGMLMMATQLVKSAGQSLQAAEVAEAKLEAVRSCGWLAVKSNNFVTTTFSVTNGIVYNGTITLAQPLTNEVYSSDVLRADVAVAWQTDQQARTFQLSTFVSKYGTAASQ